MDANLGKVLKKVIRYELTEFLSRFITDAHREFIVRAHARGSRDSLVHVIFHKLPFNRTYSITMIRIIAETMNLVNKGSR